VPFYVQGWDAELKIGLDRKSSVGAGATKLACETKQPANHKRCRLFDKAHPSIHSKLPFAPLDSLLMGK
jgi:hypothetical protein